MAKKVLLIQYTGDYREAVRRFDSGGDETYYAQKYAVNAVAEIGKQFDEVAILCCMTNESYDEILTNGVRGIGGGFKSKIDSKELIKLIEKYNPTHLIITTPIRAVISWAIKKNVKTITALADSFKSENWKDKIRNYQLARLLNNKHIDWVGNHGMNASGSLAKIGVKADKIIPWDWPHKITPDLFPAKLNPPENHIWRIIYVGSITESKGVGDILRAISILKSKKVGLTLQVIGKGELETYINLAKSLEIEDCVEFLGLVPNKDIIPSMKKADIVVIPSRHEYPEGFPMTIYEALCSRTPIIASDHPMFSGKLIDKTNSLIFPAGNSEALASTIEKLMSSPELYSNLSLASYDAWSSLQIPVKWADFIMSWLSDSDIKRQWLIEHRLSSSYYK